jgi:hypothetical protein
VKPSGDKATNTVCNQIDPSEYVITHLADIVAPWFFSFALEHLAWVASPSCGFTSAGIPFGPVAICSILRAACRGSKGVVVGAGDSGPDGTGASKGWPESEELGLLDPEELQAVLVMKRMKVSATTSIADAERLAREVPVDSTLSRAGPIALFPPDLNRAAW